MRIQSRFLLVTSAASALLIGAGLPANSQDQTAAKTPDNGWWWRGDVEVGGRFFLNNPPRNGAISPNRENSLAKFYEYNDLRPGAFGNLFLAAGSKDGLYGIDFWAKNIGYEDQSYYLSASKAGEHYANFGWDQTPHLYSTSARTIYNGVGTNTLTIPNGVRNTLQTDVANNANLRTDVLNNVRQTDIGIRRDTASFNYRWTPDDSWDVRADYSHMRRSGTQTEGVIFNNSVNPRYAEVPKPVNDTTQNFGVNGEYAGTSFWGQKFNAKIAYTGSVYQGDSYYDAQNPFQNDTLPACAGAPVATNCVPAFGRMSLWPNNNAQAISGTIGADLPFKSRYVGTISYNMMRQNQDLLPYTSNPGLYLNGTTTRADSLSALPFSSLNGEINTTLVNNILTTQITPDLRSKLSYRYYDYRNETGTRLISTAIGTDYSANSRIPAPRYSLQTSYTKQNAAAELNWRPVKSLTTGVAYGFQRYEYSFNDVDATNEHSGKVFADWAGFDGVKLRSSWLFAARRYETYTNQIQATSNGGYYNGYRSPTLADRDLNKGKVQIDLDAGPMAVVSPFVGIQYNHYLTDPYGAAETGLLKDNAWNGGVEIAFHPVAESRFFFAYTHEEHDRRFIGGSTTTRYDATLKDRVDTIMAGLDQIVIPNKLDLKLTYTLAMAPGSWYTTAFLGNPTIGVMPDTKTTWQRIDALATYKFDEDLVRRMGWNGQVVGRMRYAWERNSVNDWQIDGM
jgi:MtrB/PioB family decaheme-associated outer membrane protein